MASLLYYYSNTISDFLNQESEEIVSKLTLASPHKVDNETKKAWLDEISVMKSILPQYSGRGEAKWHKNNKAINKEYQLNAYRVLLTRARQGMVIVVPEGDSSDSTRNPELYDSTYRYLRSIGIKSID